MDFEELRKKLTPKQRIWAHEYIVDWNKTRAARVAGYSVNSATKIGFENSRKPDLVAYVEIIKGNLEEESGITKLRNLKELAKIAYSSIAHLHETWIKLKDYEALSDDQKAAIESIERETRTVVEGIDLEPVELEKVKIKLFPKGPALAEINKMMGFHEVEEKIITLSTSKIKWGDTEIEI